MSSSDTHPADPCLPIDPVLDPLRAALRKGHALLQAPTGSGKSTKVPLALMEEDWLADQRILMLEPRRPAARMTAARMAALLGEPLGERVGYQVRFERRVGPRTRIEVITEGILTRRLQRDPGLEGVALVIFDEFHERNLQSDLGLALTLDVAQSLRPELRLLVMSATLDAEPVAALLGGAAIIRGEGRSFPVEVRYADRAPETDVARSASASIRRALVEEAGDILAFLPGTGEINRCLEQLGNLTADGVDILPLHGSLPTAEQDKALLPGHGRQRRIIVATDIAETSVTIQGIRVVVDTGFTRKPRFDPGSGLTRLVTEPISRASAEQRAGRAGRLGPGVCYRLWTPAQEHGRPEHRTAEILQSDLAPVALELALWGVKDPTQLSWLDPPPAPAWSQAIDLLRALGGLDDSGGITRLGRAMAELPLHPRLAVMLLSASPADRLTAANLCALVSERDPFITGADRPRPADLGSRLHALEALRDRRPPSDMDRNRLKAVERVAAQLMRMIERSEAKSGNQTRSPGALLALAYPDRVAQRRDGTDDRYLLASGAGAVLPRDDALAVHPYLVVAAMDAKGRDGRIQLALPVDEAELQARFDARIDQAREVTWDAEREAVACRAVSRLGAITLSSRPVPLQPGDDATRLLLERIGEQFDRALNWSETARQLQARVGLMRRHDSSGDWPDLSRETLKDTLEDWLAPWIQGKTRLAELQRLDLATLLTARLSWDQQQRLEQETPTAFVTPAGNKRAIDYCAGDIPVLAAPLQELFGLDDTPRVCMNRVPVLLHLLSPARRPMQVTQDLAGFWARGYAEVRKELRGRYPKHHWPEDPAEARALVGGIKRRGVRTSG
ncbi:ATP-dependent helicase HrpB [Thiorhodococcus mannitoliphagus]|uniref:ATP-dependent helicase HrpB n=1 Tax=Thiorhodococcus mannitoliphagus TaxID=329406 RepID=A0A6P1DUP8_9GAMM|nr:ATP-dependent helicase HrpB [Thiorhodococcus mannitoliphagus]NEX19415.1 ATP-dependent helicase HrpB [Thiorhodococcus mannitoliphagus]